jgi:hypothetical protein
MHKEEGVNFCFLFWKKKKDWKKKMHISKLTFTAIFGSLDIFALFCLLKIYCIFIHSYSSNFPLSDWCDKVTLYNCGGAVSSAYYRQ